jgi:ferritin-like metal-binding protein YciE
METGKEFLRAQVNNCIAQHHALLDSIRTQVEHAEDPALRALCAKHLPHLERHQAMIETFGSTIGTEGGGAVKNAIGVVLGKARDLVDGFRETDFLRAVGDIVMIRQSQDTFGTFGRAGEAVGDVALATLGQTCEREHDLMQREFNEYVAQLFVAHLNGTAPGVSSTERAPLMA